MSREGSESGSGGGNPIAPFMTTDQAAQLITYTADIVFTLKAIMIGVAFCWASLAFIILLKCSDKKWFF